MSRARWTNHEVRRLRVLFSVYRRPSCDDLASVIPKHPPEASRKMASSLGLLKRARCGVPAERASHWLRVAHEYFARREAGLLA